MNQKLTFSIIIPCLNEEKCLPLLLSDLQNQTRSPEEVIVVDGQSTDQSVSKAQSFRPSLPLKIIVSDKRNVSVQRNLGGFAAKGKWLVFFDADTRIHPNFLELLAEKIHNADAAIGGFTCLIESESAGLQDRAMVQAFNFALLSGQALNYYNAWGCCMGATKAVFKSINGFDPQVGFAEDSELARRISKSGHDFYCFTQPRFIMSLRRFKAQGSLKVIRQASKLHLQSLTKGFASLKEQTVYPMLGGSFYEKVSEEQAISMIKLLPQAQLKRLNQFLHKYNFMHQISEAGKLQKLSRNLPTSGLKRRLNKER